MNSGWSLCSDRKSYCSGKQAQFQLFQGQVVPLANSGRMTAGSLVLLRKKLAHRPKAALLWRYFSCTSTEIAVEVRSRASPSTRPGTSSADKVAPMKKEVAPLRKSIARPKKPGILGNTGFPPESGVSEGVRVSKVQETDDEATGVATPPRRPGRSSRSTDGVAAAASATSRGRGGRPGDEYSAVVPTHLTTRVPGGDHLLLAAFPLAISRPGRAGVKLKESHKPGLPYKVIHDAISCPVSGRVVTRTLEVYGSKGPVQPSDEDVLIALIQFTHEYLAGSAGATLIVTDDEIERSGGDPKQVMMRLRKIHFKRADLLRRLGIKHLSGKNQQLIEQRMHRLSGVDLSVKNAYFQSDGTLVTSVGLRLIDSYAFFEGNRYAWFAWSPTMAQLIENGELRALDTDFYFKIDDFLGRRLFRHLNIFGRPGVTVYPFTEIVKTRLGLEPSTEYVSKCKDPVERACRELLRLGFLKSYAIDGRFVNEATITLEMPDDYQPSESFSLPFEAIIDSFRKEAEENAEPAARGGLWREQCARIERLAARSPKAREATTELTRHIYAAHGPSADALSHVVGIVEALQQCGIRPHTGIPEALRLVQSGAITPDGPSAEVQRAIAWWREKKSRGQSVGPGLLVSALREPDRVSADFSGATFDFSSEPEPDTTDGDDPPRPAADAAGIWSRILAKLESSLGARAVHDWLRPLVPVSLAATAGFDAPGIARPRMELTLWVPNATFSTFLSGQTPVAVALRAEAARSGIGGIAFAVDRPAAS